MRSTFNRCGHAAQEQPTGVPPRALKRVIVLGALAGLFSAALLLPGGRTELVSLSRPATEPVAPAEETSLVPAAEPMRESAVLHLLEANLAAMPMPATPPTPRETSPAKDPAPSEGQGEWTTVRMRVTAYCACPICCGKNADGYTACMHKIRPGDTFVAADKKYAFGTEMIVPGYNDGRPVFVKDRGRLITGDRLDVFFDSHETALQWGVRYLDVQIRRP